MTIGAVTMLAIPTSLCLALLSLAVSTTALPYQIVNSGKPKCFIVELPAETVARIHYDAPDLVLDDTGHGTIGPTYITVMERPIQHVQQLMEEEEDDDDRASREKMRKRGKIQRTPKSVELQQLVGFIDHEVWQDTELNICIRASTAGSRTPMRFGLLVDELSQEQVAKEKAGDTADVDKHLTRMESQLVHIEHLMRAMLKSADMAKSMDAVHHMHTDAMYKATTFWPFVQVGIVLVTTFTQVNHIARFFKSRRII